MKATGEYKIEQIGSFWYVTQSHYIGWWIFEREVWMMDSIGFWYKKDAEAELKNKLNLNELDYSKITDDPKVVALLNKRRDIEKQITDIDTLALVKYELETLDTNE